MRSPFLSLLLLLGCQQVITRPIPQEAVFGDSPLPTPAPLPETIPPLQPGEAWIPGHWVPTDSQWAWIPGHVVSCP